MYCLLVMVIIIWAEISKRLAMSTARSTQRFWLTFRMVFLDFIGDYM